MSRSRRQPRLTVPVLMLHHVEPAAELAARPPVHPDSYLTVEGFERLLDLLDAGGYHTPTLAEAAREAHGGESSPRRSVVLTFDDACTCFARHAWPALARRGRQATVFAVAGLLGETNRWDRSDELPADERERREALLTGPELAELAAAGAEVGCHGLLHRGLPGLDDVELDRETVEARRILGAATGRQALTFCYPWGRFDPRVREAVRRAGYLAAAAIQDHPGARHGDPWGLPRMSVRPSDSPFELGLKVSGHYRWWRRLPRLGILRALRGSTDGGAG